MCDLPENLQIIKREPSPLTTPEEKSPNSIKAKLNLHVKRRLQDINQSAEEASSHNRPPGNGIKEDRPKAETAIRQKRPYHKRINKNKTVNTTTLETTLTSLAATSGGIATTTPQRKYKHKIKQIVATAAENQQELVIANKIEEQYSNQNAGATTGATSAGDDEEGGHENDLKSGREKEKYPDVLAMVLSMKKRALMEDPEVQTFLKDVMEVIKS